MYRLGAACFWAPNNLLSNMRHKSYEVLLDHRVIRIFAHSGRLETLLDHLVGAVSKHWTGLGCLEGVYRV